MVLIIMIDVNTGEYSIYECKYGKVNVESPTQRNSQTVLLVYVIVWVAVVFGINCMRVMQAGNL